MRLNRKMVDEALLALNEAVDDVRRDDLIGDGSQLAADEYVQREAMLRTARAHPAVEAARKRRNSAGG